MFLNFSKFYFHFTSFCFVFFLVCSRCYLDFFAAFQRSVHSPIQFVYAKACILLSWKSSIIFLNFFQCIIKLWNFDCISKTSLEYCERRLILDLYYIPIIIKFCLPVLYITRHKYNDIGIDKNLILAFQKRRKIGVNCNLLLFFYNVTILFFFITGFYLYGEYLFV